MSRLYSKVEARVKLQDCLGLVTVKTKIIQTEFWMAIASFWDRVDCQ